MKLSTNTSNYSTNINKAADFGIEDSDLSHIMGILRSQIYSDKLLAVIREYSTNAADANIEAGNDNPVDVQLPTIAKPELSFRDFGNGLSDDEVCNLYVKYGASTKRSSNDYTGCLGIGCKAGFAYGDDFRVVSFTRSHITTWHARIDESKRGTISMISKVDNINRPTGTEVIVAIRKDDINSCISKAQQFFKYWRVKPTSNEKLIDINIVESTDDWALQTFEDANQYRHGRHYGGASLVMGNICYPVDFNQLNINNDAGSLAQANSVILYAPTGAVDIAANRESLEYTDRTKNAIVAMTNNMLLDLVSRTNKSVKAATSRVQASITADKYAALIPGGIHKSIVSKCTWRGLPLISSIKFGKTNIRVHEQQKSWRSSDNVWRNKSGDAMSTSLTKYTKLCVYSDDKIANNNATRRIRTLQHESKNPQMERYYVIPRSRLDDVEPKLIPGDYIDLDTIEPLKANRTASTITNGNTQKPVRVNVCTLSPNTLKSARLSKEAPPTAMADGRFVYVPLDRFDWQGHEDWLDYLDQIQKAIRFLSGLSNSSTLTPVIHGVKKHHVKKLDNKWITLDAYLTELFATWEKTNRDQSKLYAQVTSKDSHFNYDPELANIIVNCDNQDIANYGRVLIHYHKNSSYYHGQPHISDRHNLTNLFSVLYRLKLIERSEYLLDMSKYMTRNYPLLDTVTIRSWAENKNDVANHIHKYINAVTI
jgi:hypothetical protein